MFLPTIIENEDKNSQLANRIRKNYRHLKKWAKRTETDAFRLFDRDIKEYPFAVDLYGGKFCIHYFLSRADTEERALELEEEAEEALRILFGEEISIYSRHRVRRKRLEQYEKASNEEEFFTVYEHGVKFRVNLADYLDTGLFLDHRMTRQKVAEEAVGKRLLNLFAYTCAFSVHAAFKGSLFTKSVDLSNTYTAWGTENFLLNGLDLRKNVIIREDCLKFLEQEREKYDIIVIDPPTISRSKKMEGLFDVQVDHVDLIEKALRLLLPRGKIYFSTNLRTFHFNLDRFPQAREVTLIPDDFRNKRIHQSWEIED
jgi:23S rRNA (cytosine1962-C5)-methyltransferase